MNFHLCRIRGLSRMTTLALITTSLLAANAFFIPHQNGMVRSGRYHWPGRLRVIGTMDRDLPRVELPKDSWTEENSISVVKELPVKQGRRWSPLSLFRNQTDRMEVTLNYAYKYDTLLLEPVPKRKVSSSDVIGVVLIHPIGVGIARWFYERLMNSLNDTASRPDRLLIVSPDLLGSGSACEPTITDQKGSIKHVPLLNISDWSDQLIDLMETCETYQAAKGIAIGRWCVIANGGCSPIALQVAAKSLDESRHQTKQVTNVIISSSPRLPFYLNSSDKSKVAKAYKRLCGLLGRLFWWYACRKEGKFIQTFSEKNLVADPSNLGGTWRSNCYLTAKARGGMSRYSTFAFLAGCLQDGCQASLAALKGKSLVRIDVIKGRDIRQNRAKSWFWQKSKRKSSSSEEPGKPRKTFRDYAEENGNGGRELTIGGRISLAHEDPVGYAEAIVAFLDNSTRM